MCKNFVRYGIQPLSTFIVITLLFIYSIYPDFFSKKLSPTLNHPSCIMLFQGILEMSFYRKYAIVFYSQRKYMISKNEMFVHNFIL